MFLVFKVINAMCSALNVQNLTLPIQNAAKSAHEKVRRFSIHCASFVFSSYNHTKNLSPFNIAMITS